MTKNKNGTSSNIQPDIKSAKRSEVKADIPKHVKRVMSAGAMAMTMALSGMGAAHTTDAIKQYSNPDSAGWIKSPCGFDTRDAVHVGRFANAAEQVMGSLTSNSKELDYTVTAKVQTDGYGYGAAYLLNGLSDKNYWFQIGISYNAAGEDSQGPLYIPGFQVVFNIFDPEKNPVTISSNVAGMLDFSKKINAGDKVELKLYFDKGYVVMHVRDLQTNAQASIGYDSEGASTFEGTLLRSDQEGYFSGPMVERHTVADQTSASMPKLNPILPVEFSPGDKEALPMWVSTDFYILDFGWVYAFQTPSAVVPGSQSSYASNLVAISASALGELDIKFPNTADSVMVEYGKDGAFEVESAK